MTTKAESAGVPGTGAVTRLLEEMCQGNPEAAGELWSQVYRELRALASYKMSPAQRYCSNWVSLTKWRWKNANFVTIPSGSNGTFTGSWQGVTTPTAESSRSRNTTIWCCASTIGEHSSRARGSTAGTRGSCAGRLSGHQGITENHRKNHTMNLPKHNANDLFAEALRLTNPAERAAYLDQTCAGDPALRQEVESLLGAYAQAGDFLRPTISIKADSRIL